METLHFFNKAKLYAHFSTLDWGECFHAHPPIPIPTEESDLYYVKKSKALQQAVKAHRVVTRRGSHILSRQSAHRLR
jgi:hypothetical protein